MGKNNVDYCYLLGPMIRRSACLYMFASHLPYMDLCEQSSWHRYTAALTRVKDIELEAVELHSHGDNLHEQLPYCVQQTDGPKSLRDIVLWLVGLGDNDTGRLLEPRGPDTGEPDLIKEVTKTLDSSVDTQGQFQDLPCDAIGARG